MKFKVLEINDYAYDYKDKNIINYSKWHKLLREVAENPKEITFNPTKVALQKAYLYWLAERRDRMVYRFFGFLILLNIVALVVAIIMLGVNNG